MDFEVPEKIKAITGMIDEFVDRETHPAGAGVLEQAFPELLPVVEGEAQMVKTDGALGARITPRNMAAWGWTWWNMPWCRKSLGRSRRWDILSSGCQAPDAGNIEILHLHGTPEQKETYLRPLVEGKIRSCFSMTEVEMPGSNPVMMDTTAVKDGDDYVINGQKW